MLSHEVVLAFVILVALTFYVLMGGADYGGGVWDLFASGPRKREQRYLIERAIGPIWEANHVWLILVIVILFTAFPAAYALLSISLHIPLTLMLLGIVMRGAAFTFRTYDDKRDDVQERWSQVFAAASLLTPILLGITVGAISSGRIKLGHEGFLDEYIFPWLTPFPVAVGLFALALFAFLAAVYLTLETSDKDLQDDFRIRALLSGLMVAALALCVFLLAADGAPLIRQSLTDSPTTWLLQVATAVFATSALASLWKRQYRLARVCALAQVTLIVWGWGFAQFPYLVQPDITIFDAAAEKPTLSLLLLALGAGAVLLFPSFFCLFKVFKGDGALGELKDHQG